MRMGHGLSMSVGSLASVLMAVTAFAQSQLPDQYDFRKYLGIYESAKRTSDARRSSADTVLGQLRAAEGERDQFRAQVNHLEQSIAETQNNISSSQAEIS